MTVCRAIRSDYSYFVVCVGEYVFYILFRFQKDAYLRFFDRYFKNANSLVLNTSKYVHNLALVLQLILVYCLLAIICFYCYGYPTFRGIE